MIDNFDTSKAAEAFQTPEKVDWADELSKLTLWKSFPENGEVINSTAKDNQYKARHGWFENVITVVGMMEMEGELKDEKSLQAAKTLYEKFTNESFKQRLTTPEDIQIADDCTNTILKNLKH